MTFKSHFLCDREQNLKQTLCLKEEAGNHHCDSRYLQLGFEWFFRRSAKKSLAVLNFLCRMVFVKCLGLLLSLGCS